jgi:hypothetical protein
MQQMNQGGHMSGLEQTFIRAYDGGVIENIRTKKRTGKRDEDGEFIVVRDTDRVEQPFLVKLCASTRTSLLTRCTVDNVLSGFLARFVFVTGAAHPKPLVRATPAMAQAHDALLTHARDFDAKAQRVETVPIDDAVLDMHWSVEQAWAERANTSSQPETVAPSLKRLGEAVLKVAALVSIDEWDGIGAPLVAPSHFSQAFRMAERWLEDTLSVLDGLGATAFMRDTEAILASVQRTPGISRNELCRIHRRVRARDFEEALTTLVQREQIERRQVETGGRPRIVFFPLTTGEEKDE